MYLDKLVANYPKLSSGSEPAKVYVKFIVEKDGNISNLQIIRGVNSEVDKLVLEVVSSLSSWIPGLKKGNKVRSYYALPVPIKTK